MGRGVEWSCYDSYLMIGDFFFASFYLLLPFLLLYSFLLLLLVILFFFFNYYYCSLPILFIAACAMVKGEGGGDRGGRGRVICALSFFLFSSRLLVCVCIFKSLSVFSSNFRFIFEITLVRAGRS